MLLCGTTARTPHRSGAVRTDPAIASPTLRRSTRDLWVRMARARSRIGRMALRPWILSKEKKPFSPGAQCCGRKKKARHQRTLCERHFQQGVLSHSQRVCKSVRFPLAYENKKENVWSYEFLFYFLFTDSLWNVLRHRKRAGGRRAFPTTPALRYVVLSGKIMARRSRKKIRFRQTTLERRTS